ncbi:hypothetical protein SAMN05216298_0427 [Glycomyces sambucus]|uniref:Helix-turn-helix domain-containing protein n=1 Tax=Glycomyces sambucus TaxID=380244 RepID=A0A1G9CMY7_9ACTN|nr:hypothetical protein SAMN05216298_0427 [Glycomyces sambucus]
MPRQRSAEQAGEQVSSPGPIVQRADEHCELIGHVTAAWDQGRSIRDIAASIGRSYGFVHRPLAEAGVDFRTRSGARKRHRR